MTLTSERAILLTGATGYVGGRLLERLEASGREVRCLARRPDALTARVGPRTRVIQGDVLDRASLAGALQGVHTACYLVHAMAGGGDFSQLDRRAAVNFADMAAAAGVAQIVYLGGLGHERDLSAHLASRHEVGRLLRSRGVPTAELRASIVIGSGSASFETVRALIEKLPIVLAPRSVDTLSQPIAIADLLDALVGLLDLERPVDAVYEIGGADQVTYAELLREYARQRGLHRRIVSLPMISPRACRAFLGLLIPSHGRVAGEMVDSLRNETIVTKTPAHAPFRTRLLGLSTSVEDALLAEDREFAKVHWSHTLPPQPSSRWGGLRFGRRRVVSWVLRVSLEPDDAFAPIQRIGGSNGWYGMNWFWRLRGSVDRVRGGVGFRRGRRDPFELGAGEALDGWRVEQLESGRLLRLVAEMKLPGRLWLQFEVEPTAGQVLVRQTTVFDPSGLAGLAYWTLLYPIHREVFKRMLQGIHREMQSCPGSRLPGAGEGAVGLEARAQTGAR
jgi:uncharacterized protein YbjT (DUF2867 family)